MHAAVPPATDSANVPKSSLSRDVYDHLLGRFLGNELLPGHVLNRRAIAQHLGISVAPVLEALLQLEMEGFVESIPRKGTIVKPIRQEDVFGQLMLREAVECQAARLYCGSPVRAHQETLQTLAEQLESSRSDTLEHWHLEIAFHSSLIGLSGCPILLREFQRIMRLGVFYSINRILPPSVAPERLPHTVLVDRLQDPDPDVAETAIREHVRSGKLPLFVRPQPF